ncbi:MAG: LysE family translocator [Vicinamibacterales bacterium]|nr:LysE family translocator [Vicinamibacterales bacterium]
MDPLLAAYLAFTFLLVITPGATTAVVIRNTLAGGTRAGLTAAAGAAAGNTAHACVAGLGVAVLVARQPDLLTVLRIAGALYLSWLGVVTLWAAVRLPDGGVRAPDLGAVAAGQDLPSFREGVAVNLLNPAIASFYLAVVPSFVPAGAPRGWFAVLAACHVLMALACHSVWAVGLDRLRAFFHRPGARRLLQAGTGLALLALAGRVFIS